MGTEPHEGWSRQPDIWRRVEQLSSAAIRITAERDLALVLEQIVDSAREVVGCRYAALGVLNEARDGLAEFAVSGVTPEEYARIGRLPSGKGILGLLIADPRPLRLGDLTAHPQSHGFPQHHPVMRSFLGVPILGRSGPVGNLYLTEKTGAGEFTEDDEAFAVMLAAHAAVAVENARFNAERERLMTELKTLKTSRERFFAMMNHELRNALTAVHGWAELWLRKAGSDVPLAAQEVYESAARAINLLEDMLELSRLDASKLAPKIRDADAWEVIREAVRSVQPAAARRGVRVELSGPDGALRCRTDPQRIRQILINLLTNAVRHSPPDEPVSVEVRARDDGLRVDVVDQGEGIPPERQTVIFEAFERAGGETELGSGLGLAVSRKLAELLGGSLGVESTPGAGARFIFEFPRVCPGP